MLWALRVVHLSSVTDSSVSSRGSDGRAPQSVCRLSQRLPGGAESDEISFSFWASWYAAATGVGAAQSSRWSSLEVVKLVDVTFLGVVGKYRS